MSSERKLVRKSDPKLKFMGILFIIIAIFPPVLCYLVFHAFVPFAFVFTVVFGACGVGVLVLDHHEKSKIDYAKNYGRCVHTVIDRIESIEKYVSNDLGNSMHSHRLARFKVVISKDENGVEYKSEDLNDASQELIGKCVDVYVDVDDSTKYFMDFDSVSDV